MEEEIDVTKVHTDVMHALLPVADGGMKLDTFKRLCWQVIHLAQDGKDVNDLIIVEKAKKPC